MEEEILDEYQVEKPSKASLIQWWEKRRFRFNLIIGIAGIITFLIMIMIQPNIISPFGFELFGSVALIALISYNLFYIGTWLIEIVYYSMTERVIAEDRKIIFWRILVGLLMIPFLFLIGLATTV